MGRKSKYDQVKEDFPLIFRYLVDGLTEVEICKKINISTSAFATYKNQHAELRDLLKEGKGRPNAKVEQALYKSAVGYEYDEQKITTDESGKVKVEKITKYMPPQSTSMIYWLKNREAKKWRERRDPFEVDNEDRMKDVTDEQLDDEIEKLRSDK